MEHTVSIANTTKGKLPRLPFLEMKNAVLGKEYELSLVFVGTRRSQRLNRTYRGKDYPTDVLSFTLDKKTGELYITPEIAKKECKEFGRSFEKFIAFLFIHGLHHLKGMDHGSTMEKAEENIRRKFDI